MKNNRLDDLVPVEVGVNGRKKIWYIDVSKLSLSELFDLKKQLIGKSTTSITVLDAIIHQNAHSTYKETNFNKRDIEKTKDNYRNARVRIKMRKKRK